MVDFSELTHLDVGVLVSGYAFLLLTSGIPVEYAVSYIKTDDNPEIDTKYSRAGDVVGKCENVLVLTFIFAGAYTALAVIFAAEGIISMEYENRHYPAYYLAGTMVNFTYSSIVAFAIYGVIQFDVVTLMA